MRLDFKWQQNRIMQRVMLRARLRQLSRSGTPEQQQAATAALSDFDEVYFVTMTCYVEQTHESHTLDETGTPILDKITDFIKWMYESGFLEFLLKLLMGMVDSATVNSFSNLSMYNFQSAIDTFLRCNQ